MKSKQFLRCAILYLMLILKKQVTVYTFDKNTRTSCHLLLNKYFSTIKMINSFFICLSLLCILLFFLSCGSKEQEHAFQFQEEIQLMADSIFINEIFELNSWVHVDSFIFIQSSNTDTMFFVYSLPNLKLVESFGFKGQGPDEYLYPRISSDRLNQVYVYDNGKKKFQTIQILENGHKLISENVLNNLGITNFLGYIDDFIFCIKEENPKIINLNLCKIVSNEVQLLSSLNIATEPNGTSHKKDFVITNNKRTIVVAYIHQKKIEFYQIDEKNKIKKFITFSEEKKIDVNKYHYVDISSCNNFIYALYMGIEKQKISPNAFSVIEVFSKNGESISKFKLDRLIHKIIIDKEGKNLYAMSPFESDYIYMYKLGDYSKFIE